MIISSTHKFAFVHVPKCAGTSVKHALRPIDDTAGRFERIDNHAGMGRTHYAHIPLRDLATFFPDEFAQVQSYHSVALVRDPIDRFVSAIFQRLREFRRYPQSDITEDVIGAEAAEVRHYLESAPARLGLEYVHFNRQSDFIELDGERIVANIFSVEGMDAAKRFIAEATGVAIPDGRQNRTTEMRFPALKPLQRMLRKPYSLVPVERRERIRERLIRAGLYRQVAQQRFVRHGSALDGFLRDYYARDFEIHADSR